MISLNPEPLRRFRPTVTYLLETEAHVYALAVSASVLLSFYPFILVMVAICRRILHWPAGEDAIYIALSDYFPGDLAALVRRNTLSSRLLPHSIIPVLLLLFTANGIFEPLEVALNRAWGVARNRPYWKNQLVALGMIFACGTLAMISLALTGVNEQWLSSWLGEHAVIQAWVKLLVFKIAALPLSILALFLVYWLLPNRKIDPARVAPVAIAVGLFLELLKYLNLMIWPFFSDKLKNDYNIFQHSVTILIWSFVAALVVLAGAEWTARHDRADPLS
ncbi:MAG TPA: YihY/virulence factor BrkB family protein [Bryobacteraceae bacterium]|nr:YihY/virulence factor BrkB family protein [Bryobacteraceae bacterium]